MKKLAEIRNMLSNNKIPIWAVAFVVNLITALAVFVPVLIANNGYLTMSHDFTAEQIPYNILMNETIKSGNWLWNWGIDIGGNFLEAFSFYNAGSIFVWLMLIFPSSMIPKVLGGMLIFKIAVAGATSAAYFKRQIKSSYIVITASVLYAFSGYQCTSIVFFHFQDVVALFPLLLIGLEQLVEEKKHGMLAFASAINILCNYVFFFGEVLFLIIYYIVRYLVPDIAAHKKTIKEYITQIAFCMAEGLIGVLISGFIFIPSVNGIINSSRAGNHISVDSWFTVTLSDWLLYVKGFFMPAEAMNYLSSVTDASWMTTAAYLPLFGMVFVLAYVVKRKDWLARLLEVCAVICIIPVLNNSFMFFSSENYHRWFYMLIIFMILATAKVLEEPGEFPVYKSAAFSVGLIVLYVFITVKLDATTEWAKYRLGYYWFGVFISVASPVIVCVVVKYFKEKLKKISLVFTVIASVLLMGFTLYAYQHTMDNSKKNFRIYENSYGESTVIYLTEIAESLSGDSLPYRYYFDERLGHSYYNFAMTNMLPSINSFISTAHNSVFEFYEKTGSERTVWTNEGSEGVKELLGAKYIYSVTREDNYTSVGTALNSNGQLFLVYDNENALPIGYTYDTYMTYEEYEDIDDELKAAAMLRTLVIDSEDEDTVSLYLRHYDSSVDGEIDTELISEMCAEHMDEASVEFTTDDNEFTSVLYADSDKYAFYSVPYDKYWKVYVNGEEREILNINGLMAVKVDEGSNEVHFVYDYLPFKAGVCVSVIGVIAFAAYLAVFRRRKRVLINNM